MSIRKNLRRRNRTTGRDNRAWLSWVRRPETVVLEDRIVPSTINWVNEGNGSNDTDGFYGVFGANADTARLDVQAAIYDWSLIIQNFNFSNGTNTFNLNLSMSNTKGTGAEAFYPSKIDANGKPQAGSILINSGSDGKGAGYYLDPNPFDSAEFRGSITNAFALDATPRGAACGLSDLFTVAVLEITHEMGITSDPDLAFQKNANGYLHNTGTADSAYTGTLWTFTGPDVQALLTTDDGGVAETNGLPPHTADPNASNKVTYNGNTYYGVQDSDNAIYERSRRYLVSDLDALILQDAYGYTVNLPSSNINLFTGMANAYTNFDPATGDLLIRGGQTGENIYGDGSISNDSIVLRTTTYFGQSEYEVIETIGNPVPGTGPNLTFVNYFPTASVNTIEIETAAKGSSQVLIESTTANTVTTIDSRGHDSTTIGSAGLTSGINGHVGVSGTGLTALTISDRLGTTGRTIDVYNGEIDGIAPATITYSSTGTTGVTSLSLSGGSGGNVYNVHAVGNTTNLSTGTGDDTVNVVGTSASLQIENPGGHDSTTIGSAGLTSGINGHVGVSGTGITALTISDRVGTTGRTIDLYNGEIDGLAPATITYSSTATTGVTSLSLFGGSGGNVYNVHAVGNTTNLSTGTGDDTVNVVGTSASLQIENLGGHDSTTIGSEDLTSAINGHVGVSGTGITALKISDRLGTTGRTIDVYNGEIDGIAPATITYSSTATTGVTSLSLFGGSGGNVYNVHAVGNTTNLSTGTGDDTVNVVGTSASLQIENLGGHDSTTIGSEDLTSAINGHVGVSGTGITALKISDRVGTTGRTIDLYNGEIDGLAPATITYSSTATTGVTSLSLFGGSGGNVYNVHAVGNTTNLSTGTGDDTVNVVGTSASLQIENLGGHDSTTIGSEDLTSAINGHVGVSGTGITALKISDRVGTTGRTIDLYNGEIDGLAPATITYSSTATTGVTSLSLFGGSGGNVYNVHAVGNTTNLSTGTGDDTVNVVGTSASLQIENPGGHDSTTIGSAGLTSGINGHVGVSGTGITALTISDRVGTTGRTIDLYNGEIDGIAPATITYSSTATTGVTSLSLFGGSGGNVYNVHAVGNTTNLSTGTGDDTVNVQGTSASLQIDNPGGHDSTTIGSAGLTSGIGGHVGVSGTGITALTISDRLGTTGRTIDVYNGEIDGIAPATITWFSTATTGVTSISLYTGSGNDTVRTTSLSGGGFRAFDSGGVNTIVGPDAATNWTITGADAGSYGNSAFTFSGFGNLKGGSAVDIFKFSNGATLSGSIGGGGSTNTLDLSAYATATAVNMPVSRATGLGGTFTSIQSIVGGSNAANQVVGPNTASTYNVTGANAFNVGGIGFAGFGTISGGSANDSFVFANGATLSGIINGGAGTNTLNLSAYTTATAVNLVSSRATGLGGSYASIQSIVGGSNVSNQVLGPNAATTFNVTGANAFNVGGISFGGFGNIAGGTADDSFVFSAGATLSGGINGGGGNNTLNLSAYTTTTSVNMPASRITGLGGIYASIQSILGGSNASNQILGPNAASTYNLTAPNAFNVGGIGFGSFGIITGGTANDSFVFSAGATLSGGLSGGGGTNTLDFSGYTTATAVNLPASRITGLGGSYGSIQTILGGSNATNLVVGPNTASTFNVTGANAFNVGGISLGGFGNINGGTANDSFVFSAGATLSGNLNGGGGTNTLNLSAYTTATAVNLSASRITGLGGSYALIQSILGGSNAANQVVGSNTASTFNVTGANAFNVGGLSLGGFGNINGGAANDNFDFSAGATLSGGVNGGAGTNTLNLSAYTTATAVNLASSRATGLGGSYGSIQAIIGGSNASNQVVGSNTASIFNITGANAFNVGGISFGGFGTITGGTGNDDFVFSAGATLSGSLNGGSGFNDLDLSAYTTPVTVNLANSTSTGVGSTLSNIRDVKGGSGNDTLTGNNAGNILIGGAGTDAITGGTGRNILIGDAGSDTLNGGSNDDILIGGTTTLDYNFAALDSILGEWQSGNSYVTRVSNIKNGGGINGTNKLVWTSTVLDDSAVDILTGNAGTDWFFKGTADNADNGAGETVN